MKIIVLSDTHSQPLPVTLQDDLASADLILHAGDFADVDVYNQLKAVQAVRAVYGNIDGMDLRKLLPREMVFDCEGVRIGLAHGDGNPDGVMARLQKEFQGSGVQVIVFGHTHMAYQGMVDGVLFFNPGSPTDSIRAPYRSYGILDVKQGKVKAKIVKLK